MQRFAVTPIGFVHGGRREAADDHWGASRAEIALDSTRFGPEALAGLSAFSHLEVIFLFHEVAPETVETGARRPRGRVDWPLVGIFAQRARNRPNRLGLCTCRLVQIAGLRVEVEGLDAIDGSPVLDLKPVLKGFLPREETREPAWAAEIMAAYW
jgi:tRNA (Thr-GGU) A37 N-methylase